MEEVQAPPHPVFESHPVSRIDSEKGYNGAFNLKPGASELVLPLHAGNQYSGFPLVYAKGSGTFLKYIYDNSNPGCLDCVNSADGNGLNPTAIIEVGMCNWL